MKIRRDTLHFGRKKAANFGHGFRKREGGRGNLLTLLGRTLAFRIMKGKKYCTFRKTMGEGKKGQPRKKQPIRQEKGVSVPSWGEGKPQKVGSNRQKKPLLRYIIAFDGRKS